MHLIHHEALIRSYGSTYLRIRKGKERPHYLSNRFVGGQNRPAPILALAGLSKGCILTSRGPGTRSHKKGGGVNANEMEGQSWSHTVSAPTTIDLREGATT